MLQPRHATAIAEAFSLGKEAALAGPIARGEQGQVWRLTTPTRSFAAKEAFGYLNVDVLVEEGAYQEAVHAAGVPVPAVIRARDGRAFAEVDDVLVRLAGWVDLEPVDRSLDPELVGRTVAMIHRVPFRGQLPTHPWYTDPVGAARWDELATELSARRAPFAEAIAAYRDELVALEALLEAGTELQTCHRDLWADNVLPTTAGGVCVIDWENCGLADPSQELAMVLFEFADGSASRARMLNDAYRDAGGPGRVRRPGDFSMAIAQLGHIGEMACITWLDPDEPEVERERAIARVAEFTELALTRSSIEDLLDSVA